MSTLKGVNRTLADTPTAGNITKPGLLGGNVRCMIDYYEMLGTEVALDTLQMGKRLPVGAKVLDVKVLTEDLADTCTLHVGDEEDADRYMSSLDGTTAGIHTMCESLVEDSLAYEVDETTSTTLDSQIILTFATLAATLNTGARVTVVTLYTYE